MNTPLEIIQAVCQALRAHGIEPLLIGGFAVNHYGYTRATLDVDFMTASDQRATVCRALKAAGFTNMDQHDNVVFFSRPEYPMRVDVLQVDSATMGELMTRAVEVRHAQVAVKIPALEDLLAMKLFALKQGGDRRVHKDLPDVANLVVANEVDIEQPLRSLCLRFADEEIYRKVVAEIKLLRA